MRITHLPACAWACLRTCGCSGAWACACACVRACVRVTLFIQQLTRMRQIVTQFMAFLPRPHFSTLSQKWHYFRKKIFEYKMCFDFLYNFCLKHFSLCEELTEILSYMWKSLHVKYPLCTFRILMKLDFVDRFSKISNVMSYHVRPSVHLSFGIKQPGSH